MIHRLALPTPVLSTTRLPTQRAPGSSRMFSLRRNKEEHRYYLLPGMGRSNRRRHRQFLIAGLIVGLLVSACFGTLLYVLSQQGF